MPLWFCPSVAADTYKNLQPDQVKSHCACNIWIRLWRMQFVILLAAFAVLQSRIPALGENENVAVAPRPSWTGSRVVGSPEAPPPYTAEPVFTHIKWKNPVFAIP